MSCVIFPILSYFLKKLFLFHLGHIVSTDILFPGRWLHLSDAARSASQLSSLNKYGGMSYLRCLRYLLLPLLSDREYCGTGKLPIVGRCRDPWRHVRGYCWDCICSDLCVPCLLVSLPRYVKGMYFFEMRFFRFNGFSHMVEKIIQFLMSFLRWSLPYLQ